MGAVRGGRDSARKKTWEEDGGAHERINILSTVPWSNHRHTQLQTVEKLRKQQQVSAELNALARSIDRETGRRLTNSVLQPGRCYANERRRSACATTPRRPERPYAPRVSG